MFSSRILDVAIGLSFIFLLYSLLVTTVWEALAILFNLRARKLRSGIRQMLTDTRYRTFKEFILLAGTIKEGPDTGKWKLSAFLSEVIRIIKKGIGWILYVPVNLYKFLFHTVEPAKKTKKLWERFYDHPIIKNYGEGMLYRYPSYLPTENFSAIVVDLLKNLLPDYYKAQEKDKYAAYKAKAEQQLYAGSIKAKVIDADGAAVAGDTAPDVYTASEIKRRITDTGITDQKEIKAIEDQINKEVETKVRQLIIAEADIAQIKALILYSYVDDTYIPRETAGILSMMLSEAQAKAAQSLNDTFASQQAEAQRKDVAVRPDPTQIDNKTIELFRLSLNKWFDDTMGRVSGWYKRQTQYYLVALGLAMAVFFNIDTIAITNKLSVDKDARKQITEMATAYMSSHKDGPPAISGMANDTAYRSAAYSQKKYDSLVDYAQTLLKGDIDNANNLLSLGYDGFGENNKKFVREHILGNKCLEKKVLRYEVDSSVAFQKERSAMKEIIANLDRIYTRVNTTVLASSNDTASYIDTISHHPVKVITLDIQNLNKAWTDSIDLYKSRIRNINNQLAASDTVSHLDQSEFYASLTSIDEKLDTSIDLSARPIDSGAAQNAFDSAVYTRIAKKLLIDQSATSKTNNKNYQDKYTAMLGAREILLGIALPPLQQKLDWFKLYTNTIEEFNLIKLMGVRSARIDTLANIRKQLKNRLDSLQAISDHKEYYASSIVRKKAIRALYAEENKGTSLYIHMMYVLCCLFSLKGVGFLITAFAISLGAPFWFDLLNKFMQLRGAVKSDEPAKKT